MVSNPGYFSQMATGGSLTQIEDGVDNPHTGLIKALSLGVTGNYVISGFDASSVTATSATIAAGVVLRDGERVAITGSSVSLSSTYTTGYHMLVARSSALAVINPTAADKVPAFTAGDVPIAILAHTGSNPMQIQYFGTGKTENSLSIARDASGVYTEVGTISGNANGILITGTADVTLDGTNDRVYIKDATNNALKTVTPQSIADLKDISGKQDTISGASLTGVTVATDDKVLIQDTSDSDNLRTVTTQAIANLYTETQGLQDVTDNGTSTTDTITVGSLVSSGYIAGDPVVESGATIGGTDLYYFINTAAISLPPAASVAQRLFFVKNITNAACIITPQVGEFIDAIAGIAPTGLNPNPDQRTAGGAITLESGESIILVAMTDSVSPLVNGYYVFSLDTDTGIANVVEDTTPQLGGNLDVNGNSIVSTSNADINITPNGTGQVNLGNFQFDVDQSVGSGQDNYVLTYDHANTQISLEAASGGMSDVVDDTTPQLGGDLDTNSNDITGDFALTGAVQMKKAVISTGNVSPAASAADSGKYFYRASSETSNFTLPAYTNVGEQYVLMNNSGSSITIAKDSGDTLIGSTSVPHESAVTILAVAANTFFVVG
jgi:hypothetical protein